MVTRQKPDREGGQLGTESSEFQTDGFAKLPSLTVGLLTRRRMATCQKPDREGGQLGTEFF